MDDRSHPDESQSARNGAVEPEGTGEVPALGADELARLRQELGRWRKGTVADAAKRMPPRLRRYSTWSDIEVPDLVTPADLSMDYLRDLGLPGEYPFTRGVQPT